MSNPITDWIKSGMEVYGEREAAFVDRVSETAINAQKIVDERHGPFRGDGFWRNDRRSREFDHFYLANSAYKGKDEGCRSSYKAMRYYGAENAKRRDELLAKLSEGGK